MKSGCKIQEFLLFQLVNEHYTQFTSRVLIPQGSEHLRTFYKKLVGPQNLNLRRGEEKHL